MIIGSEASGHGIQIFDMKVGNRLRVFGADANPWTETVED